MTDHDTSTALRLGIVLIPIADAMTQSLTALLPDGTTIVGVDVGMTDPAELALVVSHPDLSEVPEAAYPPLVEVRPHLQFVETGWHKIDLTPFPHPIGTEHGTYSPFAETLEGDSSYDLRSGPVRETEHTGRVRSDGCVCQHSPEGHGLSGCTVKGCECRTRPRPPAFPGFTGAKVSFEDTPYNSIRDEFPPRTGR